MIITLGIAIAAFVGGGVVGAGSLKAFEAILKADVTAKVAAAKADVAAEVAKVSPDLAALVAKVKALLAAL